MSRIFERNVHCLLGLPFDAIDMPSAILQVRQAASRRESFFLSTPNVNWIVASLHDDSLRHSVARSSLSIVDGMPLVWIAKLLGIPIRARVTGSGLFESLRRDPTTGMSVFFFGGQPGVAEAACKQLNSESGGLKCAGFDCPGFGTIEEMSTDEHVAKINASAADFVVVALGARKGQAWIERNHGRLAVSVISHLGAVVDFVAGRIRRAPLWAQQSGLEWLWRIKEDPGLWKRYMSDGLVLLRLLLSRVVPLMWFIHWNKPTQPALDAAAIDLIDDGIEIVVRLRGAWVQENLSPLRELFSTMILAAKNIKIEMDGVTHVDSAFVGLVMLLQSYQKEHDRQLQIVSPRHSVRRIIKYFCAEYLCADGM